MARGGAKRCCLSLAALAVGATRRSAHRYAWNPSGMPGNRGLWCQRAEPSRRHVTTTTNGAQIVLRFSRSSTTPRRAASGRDLGDAWEYGDTEEVWAEEALARRRDAEWDDDDDDANPENEADVETVVANFEQDEAIEIARGIKVLEQYCSPERFAQIARVATSRTSRVRLCYERPTNPNNVWAALRTVDAFGVQSVDVVLDSDDAALQRSRNRGVDTVGATVSMRRQHMKSAMGSQKWLSLERHADAAALCRELKRSGYTIVATDLGAGAVPIADYFTPTSRDKYAVVFGNEEVGISDEMRSLADARVYIPMRGFAESLNLGVSTGVIVAHLRAIGLLEPNLSERERNSLIFSWLRRSVKAADLILEREGVRVRLNGRRQRRLKSDLSSSSEIVTSSSSRAEHHLDGHRSQSPSSSSSKNEPSPSTTAASS